MIFVLYWDSTPDFLEDTSRPHCSKGKFWRMQRDEVSSFLADWNICNKIPSVHRRKIQSSQNPMTAPEHSSAFFKRPIPCGRICLHILHFAFQERNVLSWGIHPSDLHKTKVSNIPEVFMPQLEHRKWGRILSSPNPCCDIANLLHWQQWKDNARGRPSRPCPAKVLLSGFVSCANVPKNVTCGLYQQLYHMCTRAIYPPK